MSLESFKRAVLDVIAIEGGLIDDPKDPGGLTNFGIALNEHPGLDAERIRSMTIGQAIDIYQKQYWQPIHGDAMPDPIAYVLLDSAVDQGVETAVRILQSALDIYDDGVVGPQTISVAKSGNVKQIITEFSAGRILRYSQSPNWVRYGTGWAARVVKNAIDSGAVS